MKTPNIKQKRALGDDLTLPERILEEVKEVLADSYGVTIPGTIAAPDGIEGYGDFDKMNNDQLGNLHALLIGYSTSLGLRLTESKIKENVAKRALDKHKAKLAIELHVAGHPKNTIDDLVAVDEHTDELETQFYMFKYMRDLLQERHEGLSSQASAVSRIITVRTTEITGNIRDNQLPSRGRFSGTFGRGQSSPPSLRKGPTPGTGLKKP